MITRHLTYVLVGMALLMSACGEPEEDRIQRLVDAKVELERKRLEAGCRAELIAKANEKVDSVIIARALQDTSARLIRPIRPDVPNLEIPDIDTLGIKPLFE